MMIEVNWKDWIFGRFVRGHPLLSYQRKKIVGLVLWGKGEGIYIIMD